MEDGYYGVGIRACPGLSLQPFPPKLPLILPALYPLTLLRTCSPALYGFCLPHQTAGTLRVGSVLPPKEKISFSGLCPQNIPSNFQTSAWGLVKGLS